LWQENDKEIEKAKTSISSIAIKITLVRME